MVFGLGGGLVGDEFGLLLTFGNYDSVLTLYFFVIVVSGGVLGILLTRYRKELEYDVLSLETGERLAYLGLWSRASPRSPSPRGCSFSARRDIAGNRDPHGRPVGCTEEKEQKTHPPKFSTLKIGAVFGPFSAEHLYPDLNPPSVCA